MKNRKAFAQFIYNKNTGGKSDINFYTSNVSTSTVLAADYLGLIDRNDPKYNNIKEYVRNRGGIVSGIVVTEFLELPSEDSLYIIFEDLHLDFPILSFRQVMEYLPE